MEVRWPLVVNQRGLKLGIKLDSKIKVSYKVCS